MKNKVPNIITGKDLDYLTDMFNWNYNAYKILSNPEISNNELNRGKEKVLDTFYSNMNNITDI